MGNQIAWIPPTSYTAMHDDTLSHSTTPLKNEMAHGKCLAWCLVNNEHPTNVSYYQAMLEEYKG
jgi:hypothetical protein